MPKFPFHLLLASVLALVACGPNPTPNASVEPEASGQQAGRPLVVGMELAYRPFEMTNEKGEPTGVSVDLAYGLGASLGRPVEIRNIPYVGLIPALQSGEIDLIISSMTANEERARVIDFSEPYVRTGLCLLVSAKSPVENFEALNTEGRSLAVKQGTTAELVARDQLANARVLVFDQEESCVLEVVQGKVDAFAYDQMSVFRHWKRHPDTTRALLEPFREEFWAIGVRKGNSELLKNVNAFLKTFREEGGFDLLAEQYLSAEKKAFDELGYRFVF